MSKAYKVNTLVFISLPFYIKRNHKNLHFTPSFKCSLVFSPSFLSSVTVKGTGALAELAKTSNIIYTGILAHFESE